MKQLDIFGVLNSQKEPDREERCPECGGYRDDKCALGLDRTAPCPRFFEPLVFDKMETHKVFVNSLVESRPSVYQVAMIFHHNGELVDVPPLKVAKDYDVGTSGAMSDDGDIFVTPKRIRIEVKGLGYHWTCLEDWPFPRFYMCSTRSWKAAVVQDARPLAFVYLNKDRDHCAVVWPHKLKGLWDQVKHEPVSDRRTPGHPPQRTTILRPEWVTFMRIEDLSWAVISGQ